MSTPSRHTSGSGGRRLSYATVAATGGASTSTSPARPTSITAPPTREGRRHSERHFPPAPAAEAEGTIRDMSAGGPGGAGAASWASDSLRYGTDRMPGTQHHDHPTFFTPSYLRSSRYVQRLRTAYEEHMAELHEATDGVAGMNHSLSTSSSSMSLNKMTGSHAHRGVVHDVIERLPPPSVEEERLHPLPTRWNEDDKMLGLEIVAEGTEVRFNGVTKTQDEAAAVRSDYFMPKEVGIYYFEVTILSRAKDGLIGIGFSSKKPTLNRLPGWEGESWAYHGDDGYVFACTASGKAYGPKFAAQDVVGCGINFRTQSAFFTKNGNYLGTAFTGIKTDRLYPSVGMKKPNEHLRMNFGRTPFVFDIDRMVEQERQDTLADISRADISGLHPPDDEDALIHNLIGQYLAHEGYVETAKCFTRDVQEMLQTMNPTPQTLPLSSDDDDIHAINRQRIRRNILDGDIDRALKLTEAHYPQVFQNERNTDTYFRLRCRKFIEMMRRYTELSTATTSSRTTVTKSADNNNGHPDRDADDDEDDDEDDDAEDQPNTQMELDDQLHRETGGPDDDDDDDMDMDASPDDPPRPPLIPAKLSSLKADQILSLAVSYGQELQRDFGPDRRPLVQKQLQDIFAIMAYTNLQGSPIGHLFDVRGRAEIAEEVNGAILVSLGKPSSAALEKVCAQTEALLNDTAAKTGGAAALVHVRRDFLRD